MSKPTQDPPRLATLRVTRARKRQPLADISNTQQLPQPSSTGTALFPSSPASSSGAISESVSSGRPQRKRRRCRRSRSVSGASEPSSGALQDADSPEDRSSKRHEEIVEKLRKFRGNPDFTPELWQVEVICRLTAGWDAIVLAGTGRGKSLLWEIAALLHPDKIFIIIVPLQAIEIDQVSKYEGTSISAIALSQSILNGRIDTGSPQNNQDTSASALTPKEGRKRLRGDLQRGRFQLIFASPEILLENPDMCLLLDDVSFCRRVAGVFVDEAHIVEDWGFRVDVRSKKAFRPEYAKVRVVRARIGLAVPCVALSATLPKTTLSSVCAALDLGRRDLLAIDAGTDRSNVSYEAHPLRSAISEMHDLLRLFEPRYGSTKDIPKTVIYVRTRMEAYRACTLLWNFLGRPSGVVRPFTSLSSDAYKAAIMQKSFRTGPVRVLVATEAGGMGIDIPDIARIIQFCLPPDLKGLAQHFGRAMRDPSQSGRAILLAPQWAFDPKSAASKALGVKVAKDKDAASKRAKLDPGLRDFINHCQCRRQILLDCMRLDTASLSSHLPDRPLRVIDVRSTSSKLGDCVSSLHRPDAPSEELSMESERRWDLAIMQLDSPLSRRGSVEVCCDLCSAVSADSSSTPLNINPPAPTTQQQQQQSPTTTIESPPVSHAYVPRIPPSDFAVVRRELAASLRAWRRTSFYTRPRPSYLNSSCLLSDQAIVNLVAQGVRILAQRIHGNRLYATYVRALLQAENVLLDDDDVDALEQHLELWLDKAERTVIISTVVYCLSVSDRRTTMNQSSHLHLAIHLFLLILSIAVVPLHATLPQLDVAPLQHINQTERRY
ncbi:hypothetical protein A4X13_0g7410 [Tilletia indica]|uniref:DNA 3'-5' helicase n=1 Tax=Tilletia indica TaxID=43049 RepID=A0A177TQR8_9BASI|nr:hypothetical protein A4X13_0g7410 [Tilletia indica]